MSLNIVDVTLHDGNDEKITIKLENSSVINISFKDQHFYTDWSDAQCINIKYVREDGSMILEMALSLYDLGITYWEVTEENKMEMARMIVNKLASQISESY